MSVPEVRVRAANSRPLRPDGAYVLYWMTRVPPRRLELRPRARGRARRLPRPAARGARGAALRLPLGLRPPARVRAGRDGRQRAGARRAPACATCPYVEPSPGAGRGLLATLAAPACVVVTDDAPVFFLPRMVAAAAARLSVRLEAVDSNGLLPLAASRTGVPDRVRVPALPAVRACLAHLDRFPAADPLAGATLPPLAGLPDEVGAALAAGVAGAARRRGRGAREAAARPRRAGGRRRTAARPRAATCWRASWPSSSRGYPEARNHPDGRRRQRAVAVPALRPHLGARGVRRGGGARRGGRPERLGGEGLRRRARAGGGWARRPRRSSTSS